MVRYQNRILHRKILVAADQAAQKLVELIVMIVSSLGATAISVTDTGVKAATGAQ